MSMLGRIAVSWLVNAVALWVADWLFDGVRIDGWGNLLVAAAVFGIVKVLLKPVLVVLSLPLIAVTFGLFLLLINIALLALTDWIAGNGFNIDGFWTYVGTVFVVWLVNAVLDRVVDLA